jgi:hypothetical protein
LAFIDATFVVNVDLRCAVKLLCPALKLHRLASKYIEMRSSFEELAAKNSKVKADPNFNI